MNKLFFGGNLDILREHIASESVDLIYLDPPFNLDMYAELQLYKTKRSEFPDLTLGSLTFKRAQREKKDSWQEGIF